MPPAPPTTPPRSDRRRRPRATWRDGLRSLVLACLAVIGGCADPATAPPVERGAPGAPVAVRAYVPHAFTSMDVGAYHGCAVRTDGVAECWGEVGMRDHFTATRAPATGDFVALGAGTYHNCALRRDGTLACWGGNAYGQAPPARAAAVGRFTSVGLGMYSTCGVRDDGALECWGSNNWGMAPSLRVASSGTYRQVAVGNVSTCALRSDGVVECWGLDLHGEAPALRTAAVGQYTWLTGGYDHRCALRTDGVVECWGLDGDGQAPPLRAATSGDYTAVDAGSYHTCALTSDGAVECWGRNVEGQAPARRTAGAGRYVEVAAAWDHTCARRTDGVVECWGTNAFGEAPLTRAATPFPVTLLPVATLTVPARVAAGEPFTVALTDAHVPGYPLATTFTYQFDCGDGTGYAAASASASRPCPTAAPGTRTVRGRLIDQDGDTASYEATVTVDAPRPAFPRTAVLDRFERPDGALGPGWGGFASPLFFRVRGERGAALVGGGIGWAHGAFGPVQEAFVTLAGLGAGVGAQGLVLKGQDPRDHALGALTVTYDPLFRTVRVGALRRHPTAVTPYPALGVRFHAGDQLGARATAEGTVEVYRNGTRVGAVALSAGDRSYFAGRGGHVGLLYLAAAGAAFDDFGGGTVVP